MSENPELEPVEASAAARKTRDAVGFWARVQDHKIIQWGLAYLGAALALAHGQELIGHAFHWPEVLARVFMIVLIAGLPVALTLAWYHGHRGLKRVSAGELTIISLLLLIGSVFFTALLRPAEVIVEATAGIERAAGSRADQPSTARRATPIAGGASDPVLPNSIAVLPFENLSPNADDEYFATGIHEQVLHQLAKISALKVIVRPSVLRYADTDLTIQDIARELGVGSVMTGSVRYANGNVRITTELIEAATEAHLWSETYTRPFENIFAIETDIATQIAAALEATLAPGEERNLVKQATESAVAYSYYLRAIASVGYAAGGLGVPAEEAAEFHRHLDRALELDSEFALAYAAKARDYAYSMGRLIPRSAGLSPEDRGTLAVANAERALELDPDTGLAYAALATVHRFNWREREARLALERALALSPNDFQVLFDAVVLNMYTRHDEEALAYARRAAQLNPLQSFLPLGIAYQWANRYDEAADVFERRLESYDRGEYLLAQIETARGNTAAALRYLGEVNRKAEWGAPTTIPSVAYLYHLLGADADARRVAAMLPAFADEYAVGAGDWALAALSTGNKAEALDWLEKAAARRAPGPDWSSIHLVVRNYYSDPVLEEPEFVAIRSRLGWR